MESGKKKGIIIAIIILILIIGLVTGGVFAYFTTDLFKSNQTLFFKYIGQALDDLKYVENTQLSKIEERKEQTPYTVEGILNYETEGKNADSNADILKNIKIGVEAKVDKLDQKAYAKTRIIHKNQDLFTLEYANGKNVYALKSDEIVTAFLGIKNENLKVLAQKLGILDTSMIPDSIKPIDINEILRITEEEKQHIQETYLSVLTQNINKQNFSKQKNVEVSKESVQYNTTAYQLNLNAEELKQIEIALLQTLKEDSITLNLITTKAKLLGLDEKYTQINNLTNEIQKQINTINNRNNISNAGISITVCVDNKVVVLSEIIVQDKMKYVIYGEVKENTNIRYLLIEKNINTTEEYSKIELKQQETRNNMESTYNVLANINDEIGISLYLTNTGAASENTLKTACEVGIHQGEASSIISYEQEMNFQDKIEDIVELNANNCGILNDYTTEQLQYLIGSIIQRVQAIVEEKKQIVGYVEKSQIYPVDLSQIEENNSMMQNNITEERSNTIQL